MLKFSIKLISPVKQHIYYRSLDFDETTEPKQLRSTGSLKEVTYAELEIQVKTI